VRRAAVTYVLVAIGLFARGARGANETDACIGAAEQSQPLQATGHLKAARELLLVCSRDVCPRVVRRDCKKWLANVEAAQPSIVVRVTDTTGEKLTDVTTTLDGAPLPGSLGEAIAVDTGEHVVRAVRPGGATKEQQLTLRRGEQNRLVILTFEARASTPPAPPPEKPAPAPAPAPTPAPAPEPDVTQTPDHAEKPGSETPPSDTGGEKPPPGSEPIPAVVWAVGGVSAAMLVTGVALWGVGLSERSSLYSGCGMTPAGCTQGQVSSSRSKLVAGDVFAALGVVGLGTAGVIGVLSRSKAAPSAAVTLLPGGGAATFRAVF
jgi:hypothetical protein